jgi:hypothetical protein
MRTSPFRVRVISIGSIIFWNYKFPQLSKWIAMKGNNIVDFELERASRQVSGEADLKKRAALIEKIKTEHSNADNDFPASEVDDMWPYGWTMNNRL